ncbi:MAG: hypothetical protein LUD72_01965, partial [Bacteroidales bacterium]|nr:hypothetical protein [Bacteroidales bacterium]
MAIIIGGARHDENGKYVNGKAGDQLQSGNGDDYSGEVSLCEFYVHKYGWYVLRPKTAELANKLAERMLASCNNKHIGYDQNNRDGIIKYGIDTTTDTECDCSSDVRECVKEASGKDPGDFTTENEASVLEATGLFESKFAYTSKTKLYVGDVLVSQQKGHTVIVCYGNARTSSGTSSTGTTSGTTSGTTTSKLSVDGQIGNKTVTKLQKVMG